MPPSLVQWAFAHSESPFPITVPLDDPPTDGNTLVAFAMLRTDIDLGSAPQDGWTAVPSAGIHLTGEATGQLWAWYRIADGDSADIELTLPAGHGAAVVMEWADLGDFTSHETEDEQAAVATMVLGSFDDATGVVIGAYIVQGSGTAGGNTQPDLAILSPGTGVYYSGIDGETDPDVSGNTPTWVIGYAEPDGETGQLEASREVGGFSTGKWGGIILYFAGEPPDPGDPPVDPGYEDPGAGHAILEIYVHDEDATRWGTATWGDNPPTGTTGIWSGAGWQDVTPQGVSAHVSWGTSRPDRGILAVQEAQSWLVTTYDPDRILDPGNPDSPYAPQLVSGVPIRISSSVSGRVIRTGIIDRISYRYKAPDYRGTIQASSSIAAAWRAEVPEDSILGDTLRERIQDAVVASGIAIGGIPLLGNDDSYPEVPLSPRIEGSQKLWTHIYKAGEEVLWVIYEDAAGTLQARPWGGPLDRGSEITYANLEDLEAASTEDGVYSVVYVTDDTEPDPVVIERVAAPLPRYGRIPYRRTETTIDADAWADAVLADRAWPGVRWTPGTVWCFTAADVEFMASLEIMERVRIVVPGVVDVSGRLLGMEMWVEAKNEEETRWLFLPRIATDGATSLGTIILVSDDTGDYLVDDEGDGEYLEYEG